MEVKIVLENLPQLRKAFKNAPAVAVVEFARALERSALKIEHDAERNAPVNKMANGGTLRQSISSRMQGQTSAIVEAKAKYASFVDQGTNPHIITVKNRKVLANRRTGQVFGKRVNHPGTSKNPFFTNAVESNQGFVNNEFQTALNNILNTIH